MSAQSSKKDLRDEEMKVLQVSKQMLEQIHQDRTFTNEARVDVMIVIVNRLVDLIAQHRVNLDGCLTLIEAQDIRLNHQEQQIATLTAQIERVKLVFEDFKTDTIQDINGHRKELDALLRASDGLADDLGALTDRCFPEPE
jgi:hypothetical protein